MRESTYEEGQIVQENEIYENGERSEVDDTSERDEFDNTAEANEIMRCKLLINDYESQLLRIPMIKLYFTQRDKRYLPFEARLLPFSCRLPKQMTRGPFMLGEGRILKRIDEDFSEMLFDLEDMECDGSNKVVKDESIQTLHAEPQGRETFVDMPVSSSLDGIYEPHRRQTLDTIYEGSAIDERIFEFPLTRSQRKVIPESRTRLQAIAEVRRIHEMAEESQNDEEELDARIWESDSTPIYCKKKKYVCHA